MSDTTTDTVAGQDSAEVDPFEEFNRAQGAGTIRDPYPRWAELRSEGPIVKIKVRELMGTNPGMNVEGLDDIEVYSAVAYAAVQEILRDATRFSSASYAMTMGPVMGRTILEMDPPEHTAHRGLIQQAFTRRSLERWKHELVTPLIHELIDGFAARGSADLVRELMFPFPVSVIAGMLGLAEEDRPNFHRWAVELISIAFNIDIATAASKRLRGLFARELAERRAAPRDDLISMLAEAELEDGTRLDDEAIFGFLSLLAPAGAETTYRSSSNLMFGLLDNPEQLDAVRNDRSLLPQAIEEGLRWECPLTGIVRMAVVDTEVCGVALPAGSIIHVNIGSANHDETRWESAEKFDIFRPSRQHMAFAFGAHACLGIHLARMETRVCLEALFDRLPDLRLDPQAEDVHITGRMFRSPRSLPVVFDRG
jgi:cytochrome P450